MCIAQIIHFTNGKELVIQPDQTVTEEILYSPEDNHELHYARITCETDGKISVSLICGLDAGNIKKGQFFETANDGINRLLSRCGYCFML